MKWQEKREHKQEERMIEAQQWYDSLDIMEQSVIVEGYNKLLQFPSLTGYPSFEDFVLRNHKVMKALDKGKHKKAFAAAEKAGKVVMGKDHD